MKKSIYKNALRFEEANRIICFVHGFGYKAARSAQGSLGDYKSKIMRWSKR